MNITTRLLALALIPLFSSMLLACIIVYQVMSVDIARQLDQVRSIEEKIISNGLKGRVETAWSVVGECFNRGISQGECQKYLEALRFGESDYIWVHRLNPQVDGSAFMLVHPDTSLVNRDLSGTIDFDRFGKLYYRGQVFGINDPAVSHIRPTNLFKAFNAVCLEQGDGIVEYYRPKVIDGKSGGVGYRKISYVKLFKPWNWVLGSGEYADHIEKEVAIETQEIKQAQNAVYMSIFGIFAGVALFFGVLVSNVSKRVGDRLDRSKQTLLDSKEKLGRSEKRLLDIAFCSADVIWEVDRDWKYCFVAGNTGKLLGVAPEELVGETPYTLMVEQEWEETERYYRRLARENRPITDHKVRCGSKAGEIIYFMRNATPILDLNGRVTGYRGVDRDITHSIREEEKRLILERELQISQKLEAVGTLAAGIAHEINTPIQFIGDNITFLAESMDDLFNGLRSLKELAMGLDDGTGSFKQAIHGVGEQYDFEFLETEIPQALDQSREGVERVSTIVRTMKDFSHMGSGALAEEDLNKAIETTIIISKNEWKYVAEMKTDFDRALPHVTCFIGDLKQVILNLILNAAHTIQDALTLRNEPMGCITIRTYIREKHAVIEIADTGMGIAEKDRKRVFEHFFTTKAVGRGTGQGLSMAYQTVVEKHKGKIEFITEEGKGTTFFVKVPLYPV